jgi:hypothetical protein
MLPAVVKPFFTLFSASILGSATPNVLRHRVVRLKHPNHKAFDKSGVCSKSPKVADAVIEALFSSLYSFLEERFYKGRTGRAQLSACGYMSRHPSYQQGLQGQIRPWSSFWTRHQMRLVTRPQSSWRLPYGVEIVCLQRPSIRAGLGTRHPILYASFDESRKTRRRRPHLNDGLLSRPGKCTGRLHQHQGLASSGNLASTAPLSFFEHCALR